MTNNVYTNAFSEVYTIINILSEKLKKNIPTQLLELIEKERNENYDFKYNDSLPIDEQDISSEAKAILTLIYRNYLCDSDEKKELDEIFEINEKKYYEKLTTNMFKNSQKPENNEEIVDNTETELVVYKENFITKIIKKFLSIFR